MLATGRAAAKRERRVNCRKMPLKLNVPRGQGEWHIGCYAGGMAQALSRMLTMTALGLAASSLSVAACTHTTDRVVEPVGSADASAPTPELDDGGLNPLTPIAHPPETVEDYRLVRAPEFGSTIAREASFKPKERPASTALSGGGAGGTDKGGVADSDRRPVAFGGGYQ